MAFIQSCPNCGMSRDDWQGDGYTKDRETFCCRGCADGTGCTCRQDEKNRAAFTNAE